MEPKAISRDAIHRALLTLTSDLPPGRVLDFPSGHGRLTHWLKQRGNEVIACDINAGVYPDSGIGIQPGDLNKEFPFENSSFDHAFCVDGPEHAENLYHTFREFYRVLKAGGTFIVTLPNFSNLESRFHYLLHGVMEPVTTGEQLRASAGGTGTFHINRPSYAMLRMALEFAGFRVTRVTYDKPKPKQMLLLPLYGVIQALTVLRGAKGEAKFWLRDSNQWNVLMGGNTQIVFCEKPRNPA
ncbi:MAG: class I SAM-dependent methyltransferase [Planctomycetes bacterium]|jgi:SAM-dependent methyltransferase|nr:class I SAM-dependent methyltransferase [Planctomycetota bacterium]